jgi:type I restriction enzyme S subunit
MQKVKLNQLCTMQSGGTPSRSKAEYYHGTIPWSKISDLEKSNDGYIYKTEEHITDLGLKSINNRLFKKGTLLLAMYGSVGKTAIAKIDLSTNQAILGINIKDNNQLDIKYLKYWFTTIKEQLLNRAVGAALANISLGIVKELEIPLPNLDTQQKIANILDKADELSQYNKQLIEKYEALTQSLFLDMFGDPVRNEKGWEKTELRNVTSKIGSGSTPRGGKEAYHSEGISLIRSLNIYDNEFKYKNLAFINDDQAKKLKNVTVESNDVLFNITGASVCRCTVVPDEVLPARVNQHVSILRPISEKLHPLFLSHLLISENIKNHLLGVGSAGGAVMEAITKEQLEKFKIPLPPIKLQIQFAERVAIIETQKQQAQEALVKSEALFQGLLQQAFNGELN